MSNAELWDLDTSGGIMEQIQLLVAPPVSADALRRSRRRRERDVYRRPGRAVNHDACDSCKEGGDLICCDRCPAAFHLLCHDPPLCEEELPTGEWLCHKCKITPQETKDEDSESTSSKSSNKSIRGKRPASSTDTDSKRSASNSGEQEQPFKSLIKAARLMNPVQFDLGKEISCNKPLPGSSKRVYGKPVKHVPKKLAYELDNGLVPLPAKTCFSCNKSCRVAPLIQCDYCPLLFHLDCLNPPLTSVPTGRWMCPNHVEHFLDSWLLKSQSLTERLRLWDRYTGLVNSHTVKVDFLNKAHNKHPMFRYKRKIPPRPSITVPPAIKFFYETRTSLLPDPVKPVPPKSTATDSPEAASASPLATLEEQEEWLLGVVSMQASIAKYLAQKQLQRTADSGGLKFSDSTPTHCKPTASVAPVVYKDMEASTSTSLSSCSDHVHKRTYSSVPSSSSNSSEFIDRDNKYMPNSVSAGEYKSSLSASVIENHGPIWTSETLPKSSVSLLQNHVNSINSSNNNSGYLPTVNGVVDILDVDVPNGMEIRKPDLSNSVRLRSNSADSFSPTGGTYSHPWFNGDGFDRGRPGHSTESHRNVMINAVNSGTAAGRILPGKPQPAKIILPSRNPVVSTNTLGIPAPWLCGPPPSEPVGVPAGSIQKVITVSATPTGRTTSSNSTSSLSKTNNLNNVAHSSSAITNLNTLLQQWIEGNSVDSEFSKIDEQLTYILAWQRLQQLLPSKSPSELSAHFQALSNASSEPPLSASSTGKRGLLNVYLSQQSGPGVAEVQARAVLCPVTGKGQAVSMPYRSLTVGTGADMNVCLNNFGHCDYVSGHHATIFYDEMSRHFELLNYSEHGTMVDNVLYSCDFSDKPATTPKLTSMVAGVRDIVSRRAGRKPGSKSQKTATNRVESRLTLDSDKVRMSARAYQTHISCSCRDSAHLVSGSGAGWEGAALLHHGSYIKLGCLQFVFSIVDHAPDRRAAHAPDTPSSSTLFSYGAAPPRFSSMPLLSNSQYLHNQPSVSLLKSQLKSSGIP